MHKSLYSLPLFALLGLVDFGGHAAVANVNQPACAGFSGSVHGVCVTGCELASQGRDLSRDYREVATRFEERVGAPFQCDETAIGSVCFSAAENICASVLADSTDYRRVGRKASVRASHCAENFEAKCEEQRWTSTDGKTNLVHTMCNDGYELCERRGRGTRAIADLCHDDESAKVSSHVGAICQTGDLR